MHRIPSCKLIIAPLALGLTFSTAPLAAAQRTEAPRTSIAIEADAISYFIGGYSGVVNLSMRNGLQIALGSGRYDVPRFVLEGDANYDAAEWTATSTSIQVLRVLYRFNGPMRNGPALGAIVLNQNWRMRSTPLNGETKFRPVSVGISGGYYQHIGKHFYVYPTVAYTYNNVQSGSTSINGTSYKVEKLAPNGSVHVGWEWSR